MRRGAAAILIATLCCASHAQVSFERLVKSSGEPGNWLTYNGSYRSAHYSGLSQIGPLNVSGLVLKWVWQASTTGKFEATPLVVDGVMYFTEPPNTVVALDTRTGRPFWMYRHPLPQPIPLCCGQINRGLAILGNTVYLGTLDAQLVALDASTGRKKWQVPVADYKDGFSITLAPLALKDRIILGPAGGDMGISGFLAAYDAETGREIWKFRTIPQPGEPGHDTWGGEAWKTGGASVWVTGSYDPELNLIYWGVGNPAPVLNASVREGANLYSNSVIALDADSGKLKWHYQFTPNDEWDFDAVQVPVLADLTWKGKPRKLMLWGNRNAFFYVLDRATGEFLMAAPFARQTWAKGIDAEGKPVKARGRVPATAARTCSPGLWARRTGSRRRSARGRACFISRRGRITTRHISAGTRNSSRGAP